MSPIEKRKNWLLRNENLIKYLYPGVTSIQGPYLTKKSPRYIVTLYGKRSGIKLTKQYAKIKMEVKLEKVLSKDETVDHVDRNSKNDRYGNLRILDKPKHAADDARRLKLPKVSCVWCGTKFQTTRQHLMRRKTERAGPFCSKSCGGKYGASVKNGGSKLKRINHDRVYYKADKRAPT